MRRPPERAWLRPLWWLALVWLLLGMVLAAYSWGEYQRTEQRERALLSQQAGVLHDNLVPQLQAIHHALAGLRADLEQGGCRADGRARLEERLRTFADAIPAVRDFSLLDAHGRVLASSNAALAGRDLSGREYFRSALRSAHADTLFVGQPRAGLSGDSVLVLGRALLGPQGELAAMVTASLDTRLFQSLLQSVRYAPDMLSGLTHGDGQPYLMLGDDEAPAGRDTPRRDCAFTRHLASGQPASMPLGPVYEQGAPYLMALRTVQPAALHMDGPLVTGVGRPASMVYAEWRAQARGLAIAYLLAGLVVATGALLMLRYRRGQNLRMRWLVAEQRRQRELLNRLAESLPGMLYQYQREPDGREHFPYVSPGVADLFGLTPDALREDAAPLLARVHPDDVPLGVDRLREAECTLADWRHEYRVNLPGYGERWLRDVARPQRLESGAVLWHGYVDDITDTKRQALQLQETERVLQHLMNEMPLGLCMVDAHRRIYFRNRRFLQDFGLGESEAPTLHAWSLQAYPDPVYRQQVAEIWSRALEQARQGDGQIPEHDYRITAQDGTQRVVAIGGLVFGAHVLAIFHDRTAQLAQSEALHRLAYADSLTGIANRRHFDQQLQSEWRRCMRSGKPLALVLLDVDHFKPFNDLYGHPRGDACLRVVAHELRSRLGRSHDLVARYGGEEFACLLPECDLEDASEIAGVLCRAVRALGIVHGASPVADVVTISLGVACQVPDAASTPEDLLARADAHLYRAKQQGRNRVDNGSDSLS